LAVVMRRFHQRYDLLVTPVTSQPVPKLGTAPEAPFLSPFNLTQQPAASLPVGTDSNGLPVGLHLVAAQYNDSLVLQVARALEHQQPFPLLHLSALREQSPNWDLA